MSVPLKTLNDHVYGERFWFRADTPVRRWAVNFMFNDEGMGGYINYTGATTWIAKNVPWVEGRIFAPRFLVPLLKDIHHEFEHFEVFASEEGHQHLERGTAIVGSYLKIGGVQQERQLLTSLSCHPFDVGFAYFTSLCPAPEDARLPVLDYSSTRLSPKLKRLKGNYCVIPVGGTVESRMPRAKHFNPIIHYVRSLGLIPVFLGKKNMLGYGEPKAKFDEEIRYDLGLDLRDQTSVKEAALIMQHAKFTLGLDGGLLHLAALMQDSKIIFGYTITSVEHREPRRDHGKTVNVFVKDEELICSGCQSKWRNMATHTFDKCYYNDFKCLEILFSDGAKRFKDAIDEVLK